MHDQLQRLLSNSPVNTKQTADRHVVTVKTSLQVEVADAKFTEVKKWKAPLLKKASNRLCVDHRFQALRVELNKVCIDPQTSALPYFARWCHQIPPT